MKSKDFEGMKFKDAEEKYGSQVLEEALEQFGLNTCDMCTRIEQSSELYWLDTLEPVNSLDAENIESALKDGYSALCKVCGEEHYNL